MSNTKFTLFVVIVIASIILTVLLFDKLFTNTNKIIIVNRCDVTLTNVVMLIEGPYTPKTIEQLELSMMNNKIIFPINQHNITFYIDYEYNGINIIHQENIEFKYFETWIFELNTTEVISYQKPESSKTTVIMESWRIGQDEREKQLED